jgi:hypothetical protein
MLQFPLEIFQSFSQHKSLRKITSLVFISLFTNIPDPPFSQSFLQNLPLNLNVLISPLSSDSQCSVKHRAFLIICDFHRSVLKKSELLLLTLYHFGYNSFFYCLTQNLPVRFEVFTAVTMKNGVFWDVTPCGSCKNRRFGGT